MPHLRMRFQPLNTDRLLEASHTLRVSIPAWLTTTHFNSRLSFTHILCVCLVVSKSWQPFLTSLLLVVVAVVLVFMVVEPVAVVVRGGISRILQPSVSQPIRSLLAAAAARILKAQIPPRSALLR
jgi:hypothetical protein